MRLIDADAFDKSIESAEVEAHRMRRYVFASALNVIRGNLREFPTAESMVRCGECKYGAPNGVYGCRLERFSCSDDSVRMYGEDFCSKGKRKGAGNEVN